MKKEIPALTKSGGLLSKFGGKKAVLEYRIWVHDKVAEDMYFKRNNLKELIKMRKQLLKDEKIAEVEQPLAVVWDDKCQDYREVCIDGINYN